MTAIGVRTATQPPAWSDEVAGTLYCKDIVDVTHDVKSFSFGPSDGSRLRFLPGQYLTFSFDIDGARLDRCYTISSPPTRAGGLTITVKRVPDGPVSNWLHDQLRIGDQVYAEGPYGRFSHALNLNERYLFLSAGSGITPVMSMLRTLCDAGDPAEVVFVHCVRTPADIVFRQELETLAAQRTMKLAVVCEADAPDEPWAGHRGRLSLPLLLSVAPDLLNRDIFTCGPPPFMAAVREMLQALGADPGRCHEESFQLDSSATEVGQATGGATYLVDFRRSGRVIDCDGSTPLLQAAHRAGLAVPSSCQEGICGTCKSVLVSGTVDMQHAGGIRQREIDQGKILLCCSKPQDDLVIDA